MRLLICTQAVDADDPILGFFHRWIEEFARHAEQVTVICLREGNHSLPENVQVLSLGKEKGAVSRFRYSLRFLRAIWNIRHAYEEVFVHMNQEYILLGGVFWKLRGTRMYMWRNHNAGSLLTDIAASFCTTIFCTSKYSYTAQYRKTVLMPVGIDTDVFNANNAVPRASRSVLFLSRIAPVKRPDMLLDALAVLRRAHVPVTASLYGDPAEHDRAYLDSLKKKVSTADLGGQVSFRHGIPNRQTPDVYRGHELFVNCSPSGLYDKTLFEAAACGCLVLATSRDWATLAGEQFAAPENDPVAFARKLELLLALPDEEKQKLRVSLRALVVEHHSVRALGERVIAAMRRKGK